MTTYYISNAGSDSNDGHSPNTPWRTLSKVSGTTIATGDTLLLRRGDRWRESLDIPRSNVLLGAYGPDRTLDTDGYNTNAPIIDGGEYVTTWTSYDGSVSDSYLTDNFTGTSGAALTTSTPEVGSGTWATVPGFANGCLISSDGMCRRGGSTGIYTNLFTASLADPDYYVEAPIKIKSLLSSDATYLILRGNPSGQGWTNFAYVALVTTSGVNVMRIGVFDQNVNKFRDTSVAFGVGDQPVLRAEIEGVEIRGYVDGVLIDTYDFTGTLPGTFASAPGQISVRMGGGSTTAGGDGVGMQYVSIDAGPLGTPTHTDVYKATLASNPLIVDMDGVYANIGAGQNHLENGEAFWLGSTLYVRRPAGQPTDTTVIAGARDHGITVTTKTGVTLQDVAVEHARDNSIQISAGSGCHLQRVMIQRSSGGAGSNGTISVSNHPNLTIDTSIVRNCGSDAIYLTTACSNASITDNRLGPVYGDGADCIHDDSTTSVASLIARNVMFGSPTSPKGLLILFGDTYTIEDNYFEGGHNFHIAAFGDHLTIRNNVFYNLDSTISIGGGGAFEITDNGATAVTDYKVHHNVFIDCNPAINIWSAGTANRTALLFYANTIINTTVPPTQYQVNFQQAISGEFKDNILWNTTGSGRAISVLSIVGGQTWTSDYNLIGPASTAFISYQGTTYDTLAAYAAAKTQDAHSLTSDPLFINPGGHAHNGSDYELKQGSPALNTALPITGYVGIPDMGAKPRTNMTTTNTPQLIGVRMGDPRDLRIPDAQLTPTIGFGL